MAKSATAMPPPPGPAAAPARPTTAGWWGRRQGGNVRITGSYCDTTVAAWGRCVSTATGNTPAESKTTAELRSPTGYTGIYANWNSDFDGDTFPDYPWDFGTTTTYPTLYTPSERQTAAAVVVDYDSDDDNLIDIRNPHQLNALRYGPRRRRPAGRRRQLFGLHRRLPQRQHRRHRHPVYGLRIHLRPATN